MGCKRKNTADGKTPPSKGRRLKAAPTLALIPVDGEAPPPPASSAMVTCHQIEDGGRLLPLASAVEEEVLEVVRLLESYMPKALLSCRQCHISLKAPIFQCSLHRHIACIDCGAGDGGCLLCTASGDAAVYKPIPFLDTMFSYYKVPCPYSKYGCASSVVYGDAAAHAAACAYAPCACRECSFEGSPAELVRHLTDKAGQHAWTEAKFKYSKVIRAVFNLQYPLPNQPLVAEDDGCVFMLLTRNFPDGTHGFKVLCVRNSAVSEPVYSSVLTVVGPLDEDSTIKVAKKVPSCPTPLEAAMAPAECALVYPEMRHGEEIHLQICISKNRRRSIYGSASARTRAHITNVVS